MEATVEYAYTLPGSRTLFPTLEPFAYLNHAAISPLSVPVMQAIEAVSRDYARRGLGAFFDWVEQRQRLKEQLATLIKATADDIGLTPNTSHGVLYIAMCFPWEAGDRIILFDGEFPANVTAWQRAAALFDLKITYLKASDFRSDGDGPGQLEQELKRGDVKLVACSAVQFQTGLRMPWEEIGSMSHQHGAQLFVDAIQALGSVELDVEHIDYLACGSHKWLMSTEGAGFVYISPERIGQLRPYTSGWLSHEDALLFLFDGPGLLRYDRPIRAHANYVEMGAPNTMGFAALGAAMTLLEPLGIPLIHTHIQGYHDALEPALIARGFVSERDPDPARRSGILSVMPPAPFTCADLAGALGERGVSCSTPDGRLRFAPHWPNHLNEIDPLLEALAESMENLRQS